MLSFPKEHLLVGALLQNNIGYKVGKHALDFDQYLLVHSVGEKLDHPRLFHLLVLDHIPLEGAFRYGNGHTILESYCRKGPVPQLYHLSEAEVLPCVDGVEVVAPAELYFVVNKRFNQRGNDLLRGETRQPNRLVDLGLSVELLVAFYPLCALAVGLA